MDTKYGKSRAGIMDLEPLFGTATVPDIFGWIQTIFFFTPGQGKKMDQKGYGEFSMWFLSPL
jgi:hypothetical protein